MAEKVRDSDGFIEAIKAGTIDNLRRLSLIEAPDQLMTAPQLKDYLERHSIVESLSEAVILNGFAYRKLPEIIRPGSTVQYFDCGLAMGVDPYDSSIVTGVQNVYFRGGRRNCIDPDRRGLFDYEYNLRFPIKDYCSEDFSLDRSHAIEASYSSHKLKMQYNSETSDHCISSQDFTGLLQETAGDLIKSIQESSSRQKERGKLASHISSIILNPGS